MVTIKGSLLSSTAIIKRSETKSCDIFKVKLTITTPFQFEFRNYIVGLGLVPVNSSHSPTAW